MIATPRRARLALRLVACLAVVPGVLTAAPAAARPLDPLPVAASVTLTTTVTVTNPGPQRDRIRAPIQPLQIHAQDSDPNQTLTFRAIGLPPGLSINHQSGVIGGEPIRVGRYDVRVTATDTTGGKDSATFTWRITR